MTSRWAPLDSRGDGGAAGEGISPFEASCVSPDTVNKNVFEMTSSFALLPGEFSPIGAEGGNKSGEHPRLERLPGPRHHVAITENIPIDPSLVDQPQLGQSGSFPGVDAPVAGRVLTSVAPVCPPLPLLSQESTWSDTSVDTSAWIASTVVYPGMWLQQQQLPPQNPYSAGYLQEMNQTSPPHDVAMVAGTIEPVWSIEPSLATETPLLGPSSQTRSTSTGESSDRGGRASPEKVKRRRGRPRLYGDNGAEMPKRKPGRPLTYASIPGSLGSVSSNISSLSPVSTMDSIVVDRGGSSAGARGESRRSSRSTKRKDSADESAEAGPADAARQAAIRTRNKAAATRYRLKTQVAVERMEAEEREVSLQRKALLACADRLRGEVFELKTEVMQHANCGCPLINEYISDVTQHALATMARRSSTSEIHPSPYTPEQRPGGVPASLEDAHALTSTNLPQVPLHAAGCTSQWAGPVTGEPNPGWHQHSKIPSFDAARHPYTDMSSYFEHPTP